MPEPARLGSTRLSTRLLIYFAVTYLVLIAALGWFVDRQTRNALLEDLAANSEDIARVALLDLPDTPDSIQGWAEQVAVTSGHRVTVVDTAGVVVADSHTDPATVDNHADRVEVAAALAGEVGRDSRRSESTGISQFYLALPPQDGHVLRVSVSEQAIADRLAPMRWGILSAFAVVGLIGVGLVAFLARRLAGPIAGIRDTTLEIASGDLGKRPGRSSVAEIDQLGLAISRLADELGERLAQSESATDTLEVVLRALPQGTILIGADEGIIYSNPRAESLLGTVPPILSALSPHPFQTIVRHARDRGESTDITVDHGAPARKLRAVATPFTEDRRVLLVVVDVTDRERAASVRRDFVANASHELKTPVSSIIASAEALRIAVERGDDSAMGFAGTVEAAAHRLDRLVSDLLDLSRLEGDAPELKRLRIDLVVSEEAGRFSAQAAQSGIDLVVDTEPAHVMGNRRDLTTAVRNLVDNAVRYTPEGGTVRVRVGEDQGAVAITVEDTGAGIPTRDLERVFERFYRVDAARSRRTGGTGLGLSIVKHVIEGHSGTVAVTSQLGVGSTFTARLPSA